jgi:hypothetical protein
MVGLKQKTYPVGLYPILEGYLTLQNIQKYFSHARFNRCAVFIGTLATQGKVNS